MPSMTRRKQATKARETCQRVDFVQHPRRIHPDSLPNVDCRTGSLLSPRATCEVDFYTVRLGPNGLRPVQSRLIRSRLARSPFFEVPVTR